MVGVSAIHMQYPRGSSSFWWKTALKSRTWKEITDNHCWLALGPLGLLGLGFWSFATGFGPPGCRGDLNLA